MWAWKKTKADRKNNQPDCYRPNDDIYPLCKGANHPQEFAENDCLRCNLYEEAVLDD